MLLKMRELREALGADIALKRPLAGMCSEMHFEIRQLTESLAADVTLVVHLAVFLFERVRQRSIAPRALGIGTERTTLGAAVIVRRQGARWRVSVDGRRGVGVNGKTWMMT